MYCCQVQEQGKEPYRVEILPEPVIPTGHRHREPHSILHSLDGIHQHTIDGIPQHTIDGTDQQSVDPTDPFEPFAENEADFQPSRFPLVIQPATQAHTSSSHPTLPEQREAVAKLEILQGNQHKSQGSTLPALTFTSPRETGYPVPGPSNHSFSIQVTE